jgi:hypothetical protein
MIRCANKASEDTGLLISDYTEDDIDVPTDMDVDENQAPAPLTNNPPPQPNGRKRNHENQPRHSGGGGGGGGDREAITKRNRTLSSDRNKAITAITTMHIGQNGEPISVTSEIQHQNSQGSVPVHEQCSRNKLEVSYVAANAGKVCFLIFITYYCLKK